jgi:hypothetical protein
LGVELIFPGIYINLFLLALYILSRRRKAPGVKLLIVASCVMAICAATDIVITIYETILNARIVQQVVHQEVDPKLALSVEMVTRTHGLWFGLNK